MPVIVEVVIVFHCTGVNHVDKAKISTMLHVCR